MMIVAWLVLLWPFVGSYLLCVFLLCENIARYRATAQKGAMVSIVLFGTIVALPLLAAGHRLLSMVALPKATMIYEEHSTVLQLGESFYARVNSPEVEVSFASTRIVAFIPTSPFSAESVANDVLFPTRVFANSDDQELKYLLVSGLMYQEYFAKIPK